VSVLFISLTTHMEGLPGSHGCLFLYVVGRRAGCASETVGQGFNALENGHEVGMCEGADPRGVSGQRGETGPQKRAAGLPWQGVHFCCERDR
jgi:hypothetical protein